MSAQPRLGLLDPALGVSGDMTGRTYLWRPCVAIGGKLTRGPAEPVVAVTRWQGNGPRNVAVRRGDGSLVIRGLRRLRPQPSVKES